MNAPPPTPYATLAIGFCGAVMTTTTGPAAGLLSGDMAGSLSLGTSGANWLSTLHVLGELLAVPLAFPLAQALGPARAMALAGGGFAACCWLIALSASAELVMLVRPAQGFFSALPTVLLMALVMRSFPPNKGQLEGLAFFALSTTLGLGLSAWVAALATGLGGWRYLFGMVGVLAALYGALVVRSMPSPPPTLAPFQRFDWRTYGFLVVGAGALLIVLDQGEQLFWLQSPFIGTSLAVGVTSLLAAFVSLRRASLPLFDPELTARPVFGLAITMALIFRFGILLVALIMPQFLARVQGFGAEQLDNVMLPMVPATLIGIAAGWAMVRYLDPRLALSTGIALFAAAAFICSALSPQWAVDEFRLAAMLTGVGQGTFMVGVLRYATWQVRPEQGPTAGGLFNLTRVLGQAAGTALLVRLINDGEHHHSARLVEALSQGDGETADRLSALAGLYARFTADSVLAGQQAAVRLRLGEQMQAFTLAYGEAFSLVAMGFLLAACLVWALPPAPREPVPTSNPASAKGKT